MKSKFLMIAVGILFFLWPQRSAFAESRWSWNETLGVSGGTLQAENSSMLVFPASLGFFLRWRQDLPRMSIAYIPQFYLSNATKKTWTTHSIGWGLVYPLQRFMLGAGVEWNLTANWVMPQAEIGYEFLRIKTGIVNQDIWMTTLGAQWVFGGRW